MSAIFLDSVGLLAVWDTSDQWHQAASAAFGQIQASYSLWFSTSFVLLECANAASRRPYRKQVDVMRKMLVDLGGLIFPSDEDWQTARDEYRNGHPGTPGVVDSISFHIMKRLGIIDAFSNVRHFKAAGFNTLF